MLKTLFALLQLLVVCSGLLAQQTIRVPQDKPTIQAAIDVAQNGDTVLVSPDSANQGRPYGEIIFKGRLITVRSTDGPTKTTLRGSGRRSVVIFQNSETSQAVLEGFTITGGKSATGAGVYCHSTAHPTLRDNIIKNNTSTNSGGGMACVGHPSMRIERCVFDSNSAANGGGGLIVSGRNSLVGPTIVACTFQNNDAPNFNSSGGGMYANTYAKPILQNCVFHDNSAYRGGAIGITHHTDVVIVNCTLYGNKARATTGGGALFCHYKSVKYRVVNSILWNNGATPVGQGTPSITYSNVQGGHAGSGNMNKDPKFLNAPALDFHLAINSPCRDNGTGAEPFLSGLDIDGNPVPWNARPDIGADEFFDAPRSIVRVSIKRVVTGTNNKTPWSADECRRIVSELNAIYTRLTGTRFVSAELGGFSDFKDPGTPVFWHSVDHSRLAEMERAAERDPCRFHWRRDAINVYLVHQITAGGNSLPLGACSFPCDPHNDIIVVRPSSIQGSGVLAHELGHYFNLLHTHEIHTNAGQQCGCDTAKYGDCVADTLDDANPNLCTKPSTFFDCHANNLRNLKYTAREHDKLRHNVLSYHAPTPLRGFVLTQGQVQRLQAALTTYRQNTVLNGVWVTPTLCAVPSVLGTSRKTVLVTSGGTPSAPVVVALVSVNSIPVPPVPVGISNLNALGSWPLPIQVHTGISGVFSLISVTLQPRSGAPALSNIANLTVK